MKRIVLAGFVALALTAAGQQKASAGGWSYSGSIGFSIGFSWQCSGCCCPPACCYGAQCYGYGYAPPVYAAPATYPSYAGAGDPAQPAQPQAPTVAGQTTLQPIGYYYGGYGSSNYAYYQAPSYWYGR
jgi:hypothetical protein